MEKDSNYEYNTMSAIDFLKNKGRLCEVIDQDCTYNCPIAAAAGGEFCENWIIMNPEKAVELIAQWAEENPPSITWNNWLHTVQKKYDTTNMPFIEWLNTDIPESAKTLYNIDNI